MKGLGACGLLVSLSAAALACSGPGVQGAIQGAIWTGRVSLGVNVLACVVSLVHCRYSTGGRAFPAIVFATVAFHPLWWSNPYGGDCGGGLLMVAPVFSGFALWALASHWFAFRRRGGPKETSGDVALHGE